MHRSTCLLVRTSALLLLLGMISAPLFATEIPFWSDFYEIRDSEVADQLRSQGVWLDASEVSCGATVCTVTLAPYLQLYNDPARPLCPDLEVFARPHGGSFHGGVLVGSDLFLSVHPADPAFCLNRRVLFGFAAESAGSALLAPLASGQTLVFEVPAEEVYGCKEILAGGTTLGWTLARLDRPVTHRRPLKLQRSGSFSPGAATVTAGYPNRLPLKVETSPLLWSGPGAGSSGAHVLGGSSGGVVLGPSNRLLGLVWTGNVLWWMNDGGCFRPSPSVQGSAAFDRPSLPADLALIPPLGLEVELPAGIPNPLSIDHYGPPGGPFSHGGLAHRLEAGTAGEGVDWSLTLLAGTPLFAPVDGEPTSGYLKPGEELEIELETTPAVALLGVGLHASGLSFNDTAYGTHDVAIHRFHVGVDSFDLACVPSPPQVECHFFGSGPSGALEGEVQDFRVTNRWETPQMLTVSGPNWLNFSAPGAGSGNPLTFMLGPEVQSLVTATVVGDGSSGTVEGRIRFQSFLGGVSMHREVRLARADLGRGVVNDALGIVFHPGDTVSVPVAFWAPDLSVSDVDLCLEVHYQRRSDEPARGEPVPGGPTLYTLISPRGVSASLAEGSGRWCWSDEVFTPAPSIFVVEAPNLGILEGQSLDGAWTLLIETPEDVEWEKATLLTLSLRFLTR